MKCAACKKSVPDSVRDRCPHCGMEFVKRCDACGVWYSGEGNFCTLCGKPLKTVVFSLEEDDNSEVALPDFVSTEESVVPPNNTVADQQNDIDDVEGTAEDDSGANMMAPPPSMAVSDNRELSYVDQIMSGEDQSVTESISEVSLEEEEEAEGEEEEEEEEFDIPISAEEILRKNAEDIPLTPLLKHQKYEVDFPDVEAYLLANHGDSFVPLLSSVKEVLQTGRGGFYSFDGDSGAGKDEIVGYFESFVVGNPPETLNVQFAEAGEYDFDYTLFIQLLRSLLLITSLDVSVIYKRVDAEFGKVLPAKKMHALAALLSLNFSPMTAKLPKDDVEYLISYALYHFAKDRPLLWIIRNAAALNMRTLKFLSRFQTVCDVIPMVIVFVASSDALVLEYLDDDKRFSFKGFSREMVIRKVEEMLDVRRLPKDIEQALTAFEGNLLGSTQLIELLKDSNLIFAMRNAWRFAKIPDSFVVPTSLRDVVENRLALLPDDAAILLQKLVLLNLHRIPMMLYITVFGEEFDAVQELANRGFVEVGDDYIGFPSRTILSIMKRRIRIGEEERSFYRMVVDKMAANMTILEDINVRWLLLSYINLSGRIGVKYNSFVYSSAVYMEKLGFFEVAQRSYQTILQSFSPDDLYDDFRWLLSIKNAQLWRFIEAKWARIFWENVLDQAKTKRMMHVSLLAEGNLLLLDEKQFKLRNMVAVIKQLHSLGCMEDELVLIDRTVDVLMESGSLDDAYTFALRGYTILYDILVGDKAKDPHRLPSFIHTIYLRSTAQLATVCIAMERFEFASKILLKSLDTARNKESTYFVSKLLLLLGKIDYLSGGDQWETYIAEGFEFALKGMEFKILRQIFLFLEENELEHFEWVLPYREHKNWLNL